MKQKHENITLSFPADLNAMLHAKFPHRGISSYVAKVVRESLEKEAAHQIKVLEAAYEEAEQDQARQKLIKEYSVLDALDDVENWQW